MDKKDSKGADTDAGGDGAKLSIDELQQQLECSLDGLAAAEVQPRLTKFGYNELPAEKVNPLLKFLTYFWGPIPWMIEVAVVLSALVQHWADFGIILALLVANAMVGFWEEFQAGNAIAALQAKLAMNARVKRGGRWSSVPRGNWFRATSFECGWATSCRPTPNCWRATRSRWTSRR